jgi:DNA-binding NtrC family response regulator
MAKILLVDDDPAILTVFKMLLGIEGHDVRTTESGEDAIEIAQQGDIDLLISDVRMSPVDGFEVLRRVHKAQANLPIIIVSAFYSPASVEKASRLGAFSFIEKPPDTQRLIKSVNEALAGCEDKDD